MSADGTVSSTHRFLDGAAMSAAISAPVWTIYLDDINRVLSFVSLLLGLSFGAWRWGRHFMIVHRRRRDDAK